MVNTVHIGSGARRPWREVLGGVWSAELGPRDITVLGYLRAADLVADPRDVAQLAEVFAALVAAAAEARVSSVNIARVAAAIAAASCEVCARAAQTLPRPLTACVSCAVTAAGASCVAGRCSLCAHTQKNEEASGG